jgi:hypothetical protein
MEAIVRRLFSDDKFRDQASKDPGAALGQYELSEVERRTLGRLCKFMVTPGFNRQSPAPNGDWM